MLKFLFKTGANALAIYFASSLVDGFTFSGSWFILAGIGAALALFQLAIYPILKIVAFPLVFLSFGLFGAVINMAALWLIDYVVPQLAIEGIIPLLWGTVILSVVNLLFSWL